MIYKYEATCYTDQFTCEEVWAFPIPARLLMPGDYVWANTLDGLIIQKNFGLIRYDVQRILHLRPKKIRSVHLSPCGGVKVKLLFATYRALMDDEVLVRCGPDDDRQGVRRYDDPTLLSLL